MAFDLIPILLQVENHLVNIWTWKSSSSLWNLSQHTHTYIPWSSWVQIALCLLICWNNVHAYILTSWDIVTFFSTPVEIICLSFYELIKKTSYKILRVRHVTRPKYQFRKLVFFLSQDWDFMLMVWCLPDEKFHVQS